MSRPGDDIRRQAVGSEREEPFPGFGEHLTRFFKSAEFALLGHRVGSVGSDLDEFGRPVGLPGEGIHFTALRSPHVADVKA